MVAGGPGSGGTRCCTGGEGWREAAGGAEDWTVLGARGASEPLEAGRG